MYKNKIELSIIIPHYNDSVLLEKLLDSIPSEKDIEVIVVDDNSDKEELKKYKEFKDKDRFSNINFLMNKTNKKGAGVCRNIGLNNASGKWILFADSDDYFIEGFYDVVSKYFCSNIEVVLFPPTSIYIDTNKEANRHINFVEILNSYSNNNNLRDELYLRYKISNPISKLIKKRFIDDHNLKFDEVIASNDVMFSTKLGHYMNDFKIDNKTIYCITRNKGSLTVNNSEKIFDSRLNVYINYCNFLKEKLNENELSFFNLKGQGYLFTSIKHGYGFKKTWNVFCEFKKNSIKPFDYRVMNPMYLIKKLLKHYRLEKTLKKYR
ncbi:glycosyltransferase family A protein [Selenihalanaerobacter shriftii]|uniref:Glycosyl transferase family 2 n=1 Tax=Selenihalanaerobacter shriftii TaxID=142842 RepID=A0A1T4QZ68_9FIRM|nr:glycosyltransferase family A protein [Selenihalanaerobacter shriftii]SKA08761.1 Glycosyl transferase family 2 [Selenihalanaerobacter shriftii]